MMNRNEPITVVIPRITTREIVATDPDGYYARARAMADAANEFDDEPVTEVRPRTFTR